MVWKKYIRKLFYRELWYFLLSILEFNRIKDIGGINIKVNRDITNNLDDDIKNNGSEVDLDDLDWKEWDLSLDNNNTIDITKKLLKEYIMTILWDFYLYEGKL